MNTEIQPVEKPPAEPDDVLAAMIEVFESESAAVEKDRFCEWYLGVWSSCEALEKKVEQQYQRIKREIQARRWALEHVFYDDFRRRVDAAIQAGPKTKDGKPKKKSVNFLTGTAGYRASRETIEFTDMDAAIAWAVENLEPAELLAAIGAIKKTEAIVSLLPRPQLAEAISQMNKTPLLERLRDTGEVPDGVKVVPSEDRFYPQSENAGQKQLPQRQEAKGDFYGTDGSEK